MQFQLFLVPEDSCLSEAGDDKNGGDDCLEILGKKTLSHFKSSVVCSGTVITTD